MIDDLTRDFRERFGRAPQVSADAPGRVNWIGEHTDYNDGLVLPMAVDRRTRVSVARRDDGVFRAASREQEGLRTFAAGDPVRQGDWCDYVRGVVAALAARGCAVPGADLAVASEVPLGAGLSSSAALAVGLVTALDAAFGFGLGARERAETAHRAEHDHVGVPCGVMDPFASALCPADHALRIDCRSLETTPVALPAGFALLVAHSGVTRRLVAGGYADRRGECERALAQAVAAGVAPPGASALRDLGADALPALRALLPDPALRRVRHVVTENERVDRLCADLAAADLAAAGAVLREGMQSLRDDFEVSVPELDALCEVADALPGVFGSRLTGAGFGGCTLHLVARDAAAAAAAAIAEGFAARLGRRPPVWRVRPGAPAAVLSS
ncbi:MAG: galactokinase [Myxococcota bacterium]